MFRSLQDNVRYRESPKTVNGRPVKIELLIKFTKSRVVTVLPTANQMNWSQMELNCVSSR